MSRANQSRNPAKRLATAVGARFERYTAQRTYDALSLEDGANDPSFLTSKIKVMGSFVTLPSRTTFDAPDLGISQGNPYLELHLPPLPDLLTRENLTASHKLMAEYVALNGLARTELTGIGGVTDKKVARAAKAMLGFSIAEVDPAQLSPELITTAECVYKRFAGAKDEFTPVFMHQSVKDLVGRYAKDDPRMADLAANPPVPLYDIEMFDYYLER